jgi:hypothetical protein
MRNRLVLVAGLLLSSCLPIKAQTPTTQIVLAQTFPGPGQNMILFAAPGLRFSPIVPRMQPHQKTSLRPAFFLAAAYKPELSLVGRVQIEEIRTPFLKESRLLIAHFWRGPQLDVFARTLRSQSSQFASSRSGVSFHYSRPSVNDQAGRASSFEARGVSLTYSFGQRAETRNGVEPWRCVLWVIGKAHGCSR